MEEKTSSPEQKFLEAIKFANHVVKSPEVQGILDFCHEAQCHIETLRRVAPDLAALSSYVETLSVVVSSFGLFGLSYQLAQKINEHEENVDNTYIREFKDLYDNKVKSLLEEVMKNMIKHSERMMKQRRIEHLKEKLKEVCQELKDTLEKVHSEGLKNRNLQTDAKYRGAASVGTAVAAAVTTYLFPLAGALVVLSGFVALFSYQNYNDLCEKKKSLKELYDSIYEVKGVIESAIRELEEMELERKIASRNHCHCCTLL